MSRPTRSIPAFLVASFATVTLAACGGSGGNAASSSSPIAQLADKGAPIAQLDSHTITQPLLNQWMTAEAGAAYYEVGGQRAPAGLVSEPSDVPACVSDLKASPLGSIRPRPTAAQLRSRCELLYDAIRYQAVTFLVASYWNLDFGAAHGVSVTNAEAQRSIEQVKRQQYPRPGQFQRSLDLRRRTLSQELFLAKIDLLLTKLHQRLASDGKLAKEASATAQDATCHAGYLVEHCREFRGHVYGGPSPSVLLRG